MPANNATAFTVTTNNASAFTEPKKNATAFTEPKKNATAFTEPKKNASALADPKKNASAFTEPKKIATAAVKNELKKNTTAAVQATVISQADPVKANSSSLAIVNKTSISIKKVDPTQSKV